MNAPTTRETADHAELAAIISDEEIARVHGHANFGPSITPREVVNEGVRKYAVGYHSGYTQLTILLEHGLITKPRPGRYDANLTKKGKKYARVLYRREAALLSEIAALRDYGRDVAKEALEYRRQRDELRKALEEIADEAPYRSGYCQSDVEYGPALSADEMQAVARQALANQGAE